MKRKITSLLAALLLMSGLTWAQTTDVLNHTVIGVPNTNYVTWSDLTLTSGAVYAGNTAGGNEAIQMRSNNNNSGIVTTTSAGMVTNITVTWNSNTNSSRILNVYGSNTAYNAATDLYSGNAGTLIGTIPNGTTELEITEEYAFIGIRSANGALWLDEIQITWEEGGTPVPSISIENNNELAYNATSGSFNFTVNNPVSGGNMTVATEEEWISNPTIAGSAVNFTTMVNQAGTAREGVITLTYTYGEQSISKPVTITQAGNPDATMTIAEVRAQGTGSVATTGTVTSCVGTTGYIQDATAAICVYGTSLTVGDVIRVSGTLSTYHGLLEITSPEVAVLSSGETVAPEVMTIADINISTNQGWYVRVENATVTAINGQNTTIAQGVNTIVVRGISSDVTYAVNDILTLNGNIGCYDGVQIANPTDVTVQQNTTPSIIVDDDTVNVPAESSQGTIVVTYQNIDEIVANVYFCDAEGAAATYNWIYAEIDDDNNIYYNVDANNGAARTAYLKVNDGDVYSNLVTINQAQYVAEYATLPFEFDGGRADIENTAGLTGYDLGSDYSSSPKLKFNNANETISSLILKFNEVPGLLTYDIKGNSFSGGTFKVQTSEDGETYTDLETYTEFGANGNSAFNESFDNLGENVRYIKWIYTEKVNGNVGIGNIHLYELGGGPVTEYDLTIEPFENLEIFTFVGGDENDPFVGAGTIQVTEGDQVMLSVAAIEGYVIQSLIVDGVEHVNDIADDETYTFIMPDHNVTISATAVEDVPPTPFEPATYTLATTIESGKTYIIVGSRTVGEVTNYYAMGEQRGNNRGGYAISVDGTTATVETADVHEVVITALEEEGFYSIYDGGYLYAAGSNKNYLRTQDSLDVNAKWSISIDSVSHIVADSSVNRNVMQFNYNGGTPIFSCYGSDSQLPVYLYVKNEGTTNTQTIELTAGYNWVSFYVEDEDGDPIALLDQLKASLGDNGLSIETNGLSTIYDGVEWFGDLDFEGIYNEQMYLVEVSADCTVGLQGTIVDPADYEFEIYPGYNWIGFPSSVEVSVADALADFEAEDEDQIEGPDGVMYYWGEWVSDGEFETLMPGQGYFYFSNSEDTKTLTFVVGGEKAKRGNSTIGGTVKRQQVGNLKAVTAKSKAEKALNRFSKSID